ncbi:MAG: hypothetical protein WCF41_16455, partial [Pseudolabrys sp.]
ALTRLGRMLRRMTPKEIGNPFQNFVSEVIGKPLPGQESFGRTNPNRFLAKRTQLFRERL